MSNTGVKRLNKCPICKVFRSEGVWINGRFQIPHRLSVCRTAIAIDKIDTKVAAMTDDEFAPLRALLRRISATN